MQLFITENYKSENNQIYIYDKEIFHQLAKVLRAKIWENIYIQDSLTRYKLSILDINNKESQIITNIISSEKNQNIVKNTTIAVPFMNKREKYERVVQKLWEIWVDKIIFRKAERSVIHELSQNKIDRFLKIAKEATEQSWWWKIPDISITKNIFDEISKFDNIYIADYDGEKPSNFSNHKNIYIVWPEWWLTKNEIEKFEKSWAKKTLLWNSILRTETAAIIWARAFTNI